MASRDRHVLIAFYNATGGANWRRNTNWNTDADLSEWYGVEVHEDRVVKLSLNWNNLEGNSEPTLQPSRVDLMRSSFYTSQGWTESGTLPEELGKLTALQKLYLSTNNLSGE
ncbi:unnamed protein product, partial [Scytosiphon promiscuus]